MANKIPKIYIDPGHGGSDPGAVKYVRERDVAVKVSNYMKACLEKNYDCDLKVSSGNQSTIERAAAANKWGADLFVSIHFNAGGGDGYEAIVYSSANKKLGQHFEKYVKAVGQNSRGVKYDPSLNVLHLTDMKAILNEIAFVDNKKDIQDWDEDDELKKMGEALAKAAATWTGAKKKTKASKDLKALYKVKLKKTMNKRTGPGTSFRKFGTHQKGKTVTIYDTNGAKTWGYTKDGWICITKEYAEKK